MSWGPWQSTSSATTGTQVRQPAELLLNDIEQQVLGGHRHGADVGRRGGRRLRAGNQSGAGHGERAGKCGGLVRRVSGTQVARV